MSECPESLKYAASHEWVKLEEDNIISIGITDYAQSELGDLVYLDLPEVGRKLAAKEQCAVIESVKTASDLFSPVSGEVLEVNEALADEPEQVNEEPYTTWLFRLKMNNPAELDVLFAATDYEALLD